MDEPIQKSQSNPAWTRDELILALDLYLKHRDSLPTKHHPEVQALSQLLGQIGKALGLNKGGSFRNENGVYMKLGNFRRWDPEYIKDGKTGLAKGNKDERLVWDEFADAPSKLAAVVAAIRGAVGSSSPEGHALAGDDEPGIEEAEEGKVLTRLHRYRERSRALVEAKKKDILRKQGRLQCEACGFDFAEAYGPAGNGIIDVHHTRPVHTLKPGEMTRLAELALLCANCHRVIHSKRPWLSVEQVRALRKKTSIHAAQNTIW
ncbi:HNH endonuclease [Pseudomonas aeruginosa]|uniref:HNH endonuclease n=1 Tax=Pseudomonas aeruginosa TaxID=287 RepID=UPI00053D4559|nr:HNH endonuclease [Pseudomonas aeruginosa]EKU7805057.1 HNH endonuclease [Pseudomonas aeruginosa]EKV3146456.1 HNH endonuclease [Pseudomonas aeruginosa]EKV6520663.1 HNH endonuclease [Pseudomonas aeruginosa]EKW5130249.1 HNH endonuclease [Pseudomonas aeruginosa]EKX4692812.1 HNH endonuclease [Pseudomonas aeruginosa]